MDANYFWQAIEGADRVTVYYARLGITRSVTGNLVNVQTALPQEAPLVLIETAREIKRIWVRDIQSIVRVGQDEPGF